ncbi:MAG: YwhD family protein, partial [Bacillus sp. (in: firmicutes)]
MDENKKKLGFNIIKSDPTDGHKGYGKGALSLDNVSPVIIDVNAGEAEIDVGAMHARSVVEKGIKFLKTQEEVPNGKPYWLVWVTIDRKE